jgi:uncharacterized protein YgbK (DUF1537 family)
LAYYGDDFTGSTDVLEALTSGGIETVLFVGPPSDDMLRRYGHVRAYGISGNSRTMSPAEMDRALPDAFRVLASHKPRFVHYKVCSTFDSSPEIGSIGRATDIGHRIFNNQLIPLVVGAPTLRRYCVFGNLFAQSGLDSATYRLDRHPTMQRHPVTPMNEADLRAHLSRQTSRPVELIDLRTLDDECEAVRAAMNRVPPPGAVVLFDTLTDNHLKTIGRLISELQEREQKSQFVVGSSGVEYALVKHWQSVGVAANADEPSSYAVEHLPSALDRTLIISGSCSPVTDRQIAWAIEHGFAEIAIDTVQLRQSKQVGLEVQELAKLIVSILDTGQSVIAHTSRGPTDSRLAATNAIMGARTAGHHEIGVVLGRVLLKVLRARAIGRVAVVGGDTSGQVARTLGIDALEMIGPLEPGAPLCVARSRDPAVDGLEISFKGGQVGYDDFFGTLLRGRSSRSLIGAQT